MFLIFLRRSKKVFHGVKYVAPRTIACQVNICKYFQYFQLAVILSKCDMEYYNLSYRYIKNI